MHRLLVGVSAVCLLFAASPARAAWLDDLWAWWYQGHDQPPPGAPPGSPTKGAPEPLTIVGLGVGAAAIGLAVWRRQKDR